MKASKGLILFCFLGVAASSCFDPPVFSDIPEITFENIQFKEIPGAGQADTLIVYLNFKDGDGDLGFDLLDPRFNEEPFNDLFYFVADGTGDTLRVTTTVVYASDGSRSYNLVEPEDGVSGKMVTAETRNLPNYGYLPPYEPGTCADYSYSDRDILVKESDALIDATYTITDTLFDGASARYFLVEEPFFNKRNPYHNNIEIVFWQDKDGDGDVDDLFDWYSEYCIDFNGRLPNITKKSGSPLEGTIRYAMENSSFKQIFSLRQMKLGIKIRDRKLHTSEEILTPEFNLGSIQVGG